MNYYNNLLFTNGSKSQIIQVTSVLRVYWTQKTYDVLYHYTIIGKVSIYILMNIMLILKWELQTQRKNYKYKSNDFI